MSDAPENQLYSAGGPFSASEWRELVPHHNDAGDLCMGRVRRVMLADEAGLMFRMCVALVGGDPLVRQLREVLEVGYGLGISAGCLRSMAARSICGAHTICEINAHLAAKARRVHPDAEVLCCDWRDLIDGPRQWDRIFFDSFNFQNPDVPAYQQLLPEIGRLLSRPGRLVFYCSEHKRADVVAYARGCGLEVEVHRFIDVSGKAYQFGVYENGN